MQVFAIRAATERHYSAETNLLDWWMFFFIFVLFDSGFQVLFSLCHKSASRITEAEGLKL